MRPVLSRVDFRPRRDMTNFLGVAKYICTPFATTIVTSLPPFEVVVLVAAEETQVHRSHSKQLPLK